jgi:hypothetical protein
MHLAQRMIQALDSKALYQGMAFSHAVSPTDIRFRARLKAVRRYEHAQ